VYDTLNRLQTLTPPAAFVASGNFGFSYDALSRRTQVTRPNGLSSIYAYDALSRLVSVLHQSGTTTLDGASYAVDNAGNLTSRTPQPSGTATNFGYDNIYLWLANCYLAHDSSGFCGLLPFFDGPSGDSFHPFPCYLGPSARTWRCPFHRCGVASPQAPTPDRKSLPATISQSIRVGPDPRRLDGALGLSNSFAPFRNRSEAFYPASPSQSLAHAKVPHTILTGSPSEARPKRTERRTHSCRPRNEAT